MRTGRCHQIIRRISMNTKKIISAICGAVLAVSAAVPALSASAAEGDFIQITVGISNAGSIAGKFYHSDLHAETDAEIGDPVFSCIFCAQDHSVDPAAAESAGYDDAVQTGEHLVCIFRSDLLRIDPVNIDMDIVIITGMVKGFSHGEVGIMQSHILTDKPDLHDS